MPNGAKNWCFTLNNPLVTRADFCGELALLETVVYYVVANEVGENGTAHFQGYVSFDKKRSLAWVRSHISGTAHWEVMRGTPAEASDYCKKDGDFEEHGELPEHQGAAGGRKRKAEFEAAYALAKNQKVREVDPEFQIKYLSTLNKIADRELAISAELEDTCGLWIYGPPGTGKTRYALNEYGGDDGKMVYRKLPNKWWDHYSGEPNVLLDDLSPETAKYLVQYLKQWMDRYPFKCEYKGGARDIRPESFIVTSNYSIEECFPEPRDAEAIRRRCDVSHFVRLGEIHNE